MKNNMKCDNCGKDMVNFHYTSNINGNVTEKHLCADCARELGYENSLFRDMSGMFESAFEDFLTPMRAWRPFRSLGGFGFPTLTVPRIELRIDDGSKSCDTPEQKNEEADEESQVDPELAKKREINLLREQMKEAAAKEEFEKAAEIRDRLREMEEK